jgi:hypothetical protein
MAATASGKAQIIRWLNRLYVRANAGWYHAKKTAGCGKNGLCDCVRFRILGPLWFPSRGCAPYNVAMTLLDAPKYNARKALIRRNIIIGIIVAIPFVAFFTWYWWNWPEEHRVNQFFHSIEAKDYSHAYALWNNDPDWQQHLDQYKLYTLDQFKSDWGPTGDYGVITKAKIVVTKEYGSGVVIGVRVNDSPKILFLWVEKKAKNIGFSPVELRF